jgi:hypothetical protein
MVDDRRNTATKKQAAETRGSDRPEVENPIHRCTGPFGSQEHC